MSSFARNILVTPFGLAVLAALLALGLYGVGRFLLAGAGADELAIGAACLIGAGVGIWERRRRLASGAVEDEA